ncbi:hypothetical protein A3D77_02160 [Candidatus Gottesmanbacteria bacterium RIFCSPHIGHO2_02_FULL_39_11]|uniref:Uncharacterized protein n=1 Tax=Candidatus Gottesmanbacteria bacterium RIFCSPHIGHO2_02_FULL_39_11 TaxID=1798382 RepID=A0A1F5ZUS2_9BACT|nr:MAG: hypothetical protein A3D77_02160 [Candidatus Gottesmanbacteria bacterium RIFCSPHIGHO2_02_FULL_39_11]
MSERLIYKPSQKEEHVLPRRTILKIGAAAPITIAASLGGLSRREAYAEEDTSFMLGRVNLSKQFAEIIGESVYPMDPLPQRSRAINPEDVVAFDRWYGSGWNDTIIFHTSIPNIHVLYGHTRNRWVRGEKVRLPHEWIRSANAGGYMALEQGKEVAKLALTFSTKVKTSYFWNSVRPNQNEVAEFQIENIALPSDIVNDITNGGIIFVGCGDKVDGEFINQQVLVAKLYE